MAWYFIDEQLNKTICKLFFSDMVANASVQLLNPNIARKGTATQISTYSRSTTSIDHAYHSIDGDFSTDISGGALCATTRSNAGAWWQVDLSVKSLIVNVSVTTRRNYGNFLYSFSFVSIGHHHFSQLKENPVINYRHLLQILGVGRADRVLQPFLSGIHHSSHSSQYIWSKFILGYIRHTDEFFTLPVQASPIDLC